MNTPSANILFKWKYYPHNTTVNRRVLLVLTYSIKESYSKGNFTHKGKTLETSCFRLYNSTPGDPYRSTINTFIEQYYGDFWTPQHCASTGISRFLTIVILEYVWTSQETAIHIMKA
ncbi:hypothetical protein C922_05827 [Plasmodium inui San Antonio 1]|uniref:Uncharacterized protein n=1 Tax=Plasmodium inui San Antonio 1 TaxID=1237626 RepID=W6ZSB1_9APIC|nr:hypothetical protein C922_05827 [Plasmodium inui San Antonio 1]EUD63792.1 hypothetical protein C922_05827 [Plasmodium inui San Antonio 1]